MPKYIYECTSCNKITEVRHSIKEKIEDCAFCDKEKTLHRIPAIPTIIKNKTVGNKSKAGELVKEFIEEARSEVKSEKENLSSREYK